MQHLTASAGSFAHAEAANTSLLQPLTASVASIGSAIGALPGELVNLYNAAVGQLLNLLSGFQNILFTLIGVLFAIAFIAIIVAYYQLTGMPLFTFPFPLF